MAGFFYDLDGRDTPAYKLGLRQLAEWHDICRQKRLGIPEARKKMNKRIYLAKLERDSENHRIHRLKGFES